MFFHCNSQPCITVDANSFLSSYHSHIKSTACDIVKDREENESVFNAMVNCFRDCLRIVIYPYICLFFVFNSCVIRNIINLSRTKGNFKV